MSGKGGVSGNYSQVAMKCQVQMFVLSANIFPVPTVSVCKCELPYSKAPRMFDNRGTWGSEEAKGCNQGREVEAGLFVGWTGTG